MTAAKKPPRKKYIIADDYSDSFDIIDALTPEEALEIYVELNDLDDDVDRRTFYAGELLGMYTAETRKIEWKKV